jgi:predicted HTH domain antitoxin
MVADMVIEGDVLQKAQISAQELRLQIALYLYEKGRLSFGQAKRVAGLNHLAFQKALADNGLYLNYDSDDLEDDLETLRKQPRKAGWGIGLFPYVAPDFDETPECFEEYLLPTQP